jgi:hypothetical protein
MLYNQLSPTIKIVQMIVGLIPPAFAWVRTGDWTTALWVFLIGFAAGSVIFKQYLKMQFPNSKRNAEGDFDLDVKERGQARAMPVFLWSGPICAAVAAAFFIYND